MSIAKYSFLSWMRQGLGKYITPPTGNQLRGKVDIELKIEGSSSAISESIEMLGPGDITALDTSNIVRLHPEPHTGDFEANYLPFIEFYQDTFLWDYSPVQPNGQRLQPWLFLLVVAEGEYELQENPQGLDKVTLNQTGLFPPDDQSWAWAHVHVNADTATLSSLQSQLENNRDFAVCRLMSPRRLQPTTNYTAMVVPAYEIGRLTGLGLPIDPGVAGFNAQASSWGNSQMEFPVYYRWSFQTGLRGDFESLVRELVPRKDLDPSIGFRPMDIKGAATPYNINTPSIDEFPLGGALKRVGSAPPIFPDADWQLEISSLLNKRSGQQQSDHNTAADPVIVPPTYGHWHALVDQLNQGNDAGPIDKGDSAWLHSLNLDPANRAAAGLGTKVVQEHQDKFLAIAWDQIGSVLEANQLIRQSQLGIEIAVRWWDKHISSQLPGEMVSTVEPLLSNIICTDKPVPNIYVNIAQSGTPPAVFSPTFRRLSSRRGRIMKKLRKNRQGKPAYPSLAGGLTQGLQVVPPKKTADGKDGVPYTDAPNTPSGRIPLIPCKFPGFPGKERVIVFPDAYMKYIELPAGTNGVEVPEEDYLNAWIGLTRKFNCEPPAAAPPPIDLPGLIPCIEAALDPAQTIKDRTLNKIGTEADLDAIIPILAAPDYPEPMYKKLRDQSADFILPNLNKLQNNTITLMEANQAFIEAYMVGLNYEMARELLWNEYPTDQRGSYFRQFWDISKYVVKGAPDPKDLAEKLKDIDFIHRWLKWTDMGDHRMSNRLPSDPPSTTPLVLTIRGDLLNRYPEAIIMAVPAATGGGFNSAATAKYPIFSAKVEPDITFLGFELTADEARGNGGSDPGWYFCIKEPNTGPRFGMDIDTGLASPPDPSSWNDLHWGHMENSTLIRLDETTFADSVIDGSWGDHSAGMASILYQVPVMIAIHASQMLPNA